MRAKPASGPTTDGAVTPSAAELEFLTHAYGREYSDELSKQNRRVMTMTHDTLTV